MLMEGDRVVVFGIDDERKYFGIALKSALGGVGEQGAADALTVEAAIDREPADQRRRQQRSFAYADHPHESRLRIHRRPACAHRFLLEELLHCIGPNQHGLRGRRCTGGPRGGKDQGLQQRDAGKFSALIQRRRAGESGRRLRR